MCSGDHVVERLSPDHRRLPGIGLGIATRLAERGFGLTVAGRDAQRLAEASAVLRERGAPDVSCQPGDVLDDDYPATLVDSHAARFGGCDALVVNARVGSSGPLGDSTRSASISRSRSTCAVRSS